MSLESAPPTPILDAAQLRRIDDALSRHGLSRRGEPVPIPNSVLNQNFRVPTTRQDVVVRLHAPKNKLDRLERERRAMLFARERGIPVRPPLTASDGRHFHSIGGLLVSVYPWLDALVPRRGSINPEQAATMGEMQGRIHRALRDFSDPELTDKSGWDTEQSIADLSRVDDLIRYYPAPGETQLRIQEGLRFKLELLESPAARPRSDFAALPLQPVHGDYHDGNVLFAADGSVLAVIDWERVGLVPALPEVLRSVTFSLLLEPDLLTPYLQGYALHDVFPAEDCALGVEMWWQAMLHDTWIYTERFVRGVRTVDHFFADDAVRHRQFADPAYRQWLTGQVREHASA
jgi:Ser/Thr protein kinase RdoA (MazF antagonist)